MRAPRFLAVPIAVAALLAASACSGDDLAGDSGSGDKGSLTLSGANFAEGTLVAEIYKAALEDAGYSVDLKLVGARDVYMKQFPQDIDVVPEYLGGIADYLNAQKNGADADPVTTPDPDETLAAAEPLVEEAGITLLEPSEATDQNAFFVTKEFADQHKLKTLSDLGELGEPVTLASAPDCEGRTDCEGGLSKTYGIDISKINPLGYASAATYKSVLTGESQLGETATTDGTLEQQGLVLLEDDQSIQPAQNLVPAVSTAFLEDHPDVEDVLNEIMAAMTTEKLTELNGKVSNDREKPADVARQWLEDEGLLS